MVLTLLTCERKGVEIRWIKMYLINRKSRVFAEDIKMLCTVLFTLLFGLGNGVKTLFNLGNFFFGFVIFFNFILNFAAGVHGRGMVSAT